MNFTLRKLKDDESDFKKIYEWCSNESVYEWFEQRKLSLEEISDKYKKKLKENKQEIYIIEYDNKNIGLVQIYNFQNDINLEEVNKYKNIYEYDIFIGEDDYLSKGIGTILCSFINEMLQYRYNADLIILRPFKRNIRAIKCYKKCGFRVINEYEGTDTLGNKETILVLSKGLL